MNPHTVLTIVLDPKSSASTNSATLADRILFSLFLLGCQALSRRVENQNRRQKEMDSDFEIKLECPYHHCNHKPSSSLISCMALRATSRNSPKASPVFSISAINSLLQLRANALDLYLTEYGMQQRRKP